MSGQTAKRQKKKKPIQSFKLIEIEKLQLENIQLKTRALEQALEQVRAEQRVWGVTVAKRHKVDLGQFTINPDTGECLRRELKAVPENKGGEK